MWLINLTVRPLFFIFSFLFWHKKSSNILRGVTARGYAYNTSPRINVLSADAHIRMSKLQGFLNSPLRRKMTPWKVNRDARTPRVVIDLMACRNQSANGAEAHATFRKSHYQTASIQCMPIHDICINSMTFDPSNALHSGQGFFPPNLVTIGHFWANWPYLTPADPFVTFDPSNALRFIRNSSHQIWWPQVNPKQLTPGWPQLTPAWP